MMMGNAFNLQVHHMIEKCLIFKMSKQECMEALSKHANIQPVITSTGHSLSLSLSCKYVSIEIDQPNPS